MKQPSPLSLRITPAEKSQLAKIAQQHGTNRNQFIKNAISAFVNSLETKNCTALSQPKDPSDEELDELWDETCAYYALYEEARRFAREVLACYAHKA